MKKTILLFSLICALGKAQVNVWQCHTINYYDTIQQKRVTVDLNCDSVLVQPAWTSLQNDLYDTTHASLFSYAADFAKPNYWSALLKCITDGQQNKSTPQTFLYLLMKCAIPFNQNQKQELNAIFRKNYFAIQLQ